MSQWHVCRHYSALTPCQLPHLLYALSVSHLLQTYTSKSACGCLCLCVCVCVCVWWRVCVSMQTVYKSRPVALLPSKYSTGLCQDLIETERNRIDGQLFTKHSVLRKVCAWTNCWPWVYNCIVLLNRFVKFQTRQTANCPSTRLPLHCIAATLPG